MKRKQRSCWNILGNPSVCMCSMSSVELSQWKGIKVMDIPSMENLCDVTDPIPCLDYVCFVVSYRDNNRGIMESIFGYMPETFLIK